MTIINATDHVELACRQFLKDHPAIPLVLQTGRLRNYTTTRTPAGAEMVMDQGCVRLIPGFDGVAVSGSGRYMFGVNDCVGETTLVPHGTTYENPDVSVIAGDEFQAAILAAVEAKLADLEEARTDA